MKELVNTTLPNTKPLMAFAMTLLAILVMSSLSGCIDFSPPTSYSFKKNTKATEHQIEIAEELGYTDSQIEALRSKPIESYDTFLELTVATDIIDHMEERYHMDFTAQAVDKYHTSYHYMNIVANDDKFKNRTFRVEAYENRDGSVSYKDNFFIAYRRDDICDIIGNIVEETLDNAGIESDYNVSITFDDFVSHDMPADGDFPHEVSCKFTPEIALYGTYLTDEQVSNLHFAIKDRVQKKFRTGNDLITRSFPNCSTYAEAFQSAPEWCYMGNEKSVTIGDYRSENDAKNSES